MKSKTASLGPGRYRSRSSRAVKVLARMDIAERRDFAAARSGAAFTVETDAERAGPPPGLRASPASSARRSSSAYRLLGQELIGFDQLGLRPDVRARVREIVRRPQGLRGDLRAYGIGQDVDALLVHAAPGHGARQRHDARGPRGGRHSLHHPGADPRARGVHLRERSARHSAPGSRRHTRRRDPRLRNGVDRAPGCANGAPRPHDRSTRRTPWRPSCGSSTSA